MEKPPMTDQANSEALNTTIGNLRGVLDVLRMGSEIDRERLESLLAVAVGRLEDVVAAPEPAAEPREGEVERLREALEAISMALDEAEPAARRLQPGVLRGVFYWSRHKVAAALRSEGGSDG